MAVLLAKSRTFRHVGQSWSVFLVTGGGREMQRFDMSRRDCALLAVAAVYVISPIDIVPEIIAGPLGLTDDLAALTAVVWTLVRAHRREPRPTRPPTDVHSSPGIPAVSKGGSRKRRG